MKFNNKVLYALMAAGLALPTASVQAWPWKWGGAAPLIQKAEEKVKEEVKKEAEKQSSLAWKATKVVGNVALDASIALAKGTGRFAWNNPKLSLGLVAAGYTYYRHKETIDKMLPYVKTGIKASLMAYGAYKTVEATNNAIQAGSNLVSSISNLMPQSNKPADQVKTNEQIKKDEPDMNDLAEQMVQEFEALQAQEREAELEEQRKKSDWAQEYQAEQARIEKAKADTLNRAQERARLSGLTQKDVKGMEIAWNAPAIPNVANIDKQLTTDVATLNRVEAESVNRLALDDVESRELVEQFTPTPHNDPLADLRNEQFKQEMMKRAQTRVDTMKGHPWIDEYLKEEEAKEAAQKATQHPKLNEWIQEYKNNNAMERAINIASQSMGIDPEEFRELIMARKAKDQAAREEHALMMTNDIRNISNASNPCEAPAPLLRQFS